MFRTYAGDTISRTVTIPGSGALSTETFEAHVRLPSGRSATASASVSNAASRQVTVTVAADEWHRAEGGFGRLQVRMTASGVKSVEHDERFRVMPGLAVAHDPADYW